jgi:uncharacterized lipoprotein YddW (UPF0748 family)
MKKRARLVQVTVSDEELQSLRSKAESRGLSVAAWLRFAGLGHETALYESASPAGATSAEERYKLAGEAALRQNQANAAAAGREY